MLIPLIFILIYSISRYNDVSFMYLHNGSEWYQYLTYNFVHTSFLHLSVNTTAYILYWNALVRSGVAKLETIIISLSSAFFSGIICAYSETPTIGASAIVFSMLGVFCVRVPSPTIKTGVIRYVIILSFMAIQAFFNSGINWGIHLFSLLISTVISLILKECRALIKY